MSSEKTVGQTEPPQRPEPTATTVDRDNGSRSDIEHIHTEPGARRTSNVQMLVIEAELANDGKALGNPAKPVSEDIGEQFFERLDDHDDDLEPAWTRPWEQPDDIAAKTTEDVI